MGGQAKSWLNEYGEIVANRLSAGKSTKILLPLGILLLSTISLIAVGIMAITRIGSADEITLLTLPTTVPTISLPVIQNEDLILTSPTPVLVEGSWESFQVIPTPAPTPTLYPCWLDPGLTLRNSWTAQLRQKLGCPTTEERGIITAYQPFERGFMLWRADTEQIYVFFDDGSTQLLQDTWREGDPEYTCPDRATPSQTPPTPRRGFGRAWCIERNLRQRLGNALADESGDYRLVQDFEHGAMIVIPERQQAYLFSIETSGFVLTICQQMVAYAQQEQWGEVLSQAESARTRYGDTLR